MSALTAKDGQANNSTENQPQQPGILKVLLSFAAAGIADFLNLTDFAIPLIYVLIDLVTVVILLAIWGIRRELLLTLMLELIPGLNLFPTWTAVVGFLCYRASQPRQAEMTPPKNDASQRQL